MLPFVHRERVVFGDLDAMRHLNNVVFLRYFETARINFIRELVGEAPFSPDGAGGFGLIFAECHINYRAPVHWDDDVAISCGVRDVRRSSFQVPFEMHVGDRLVAEGYGVLVGFDYAAQRAAALPDEFRQRLEAQLQASPTPS